MQQGVLLKAFGGFYFVESAGQTYAWSLRGRLKQVLKKQPLGLLAGDEVLFEPLSDTEGVVEALQPRRNHLIRPKIANVDQCLVILAVQHPEPDLLLLDRLLVSLYAAGIEPLLCLNKIDLPGSAELYQKIHDAYCRTGMTILGISALNDQGLDTLHERLAGRHSTVAGPSGAGKSTLLNLLQSERVLQTGEISRKLQRGRHTTRTVELLPLAGGGWVADTPGFSRLDFSLEITPDNLAGFYPDFLPLAEHCRFESCRHEQEPDCCVKAAVEAGEFPAERYQRYLILRELLRQRSLY
ncbi:MAG: ribosome small subunit-dependent GTPase A [Firmicutes bacterium]|nr:ribosome small subunit-dependent GTPase A [Bacillota bacterium]